ncbi:MAG: hypothetical protein ACD_80C00118G0022 [uncultured bacterium (gcode 4)]|uniref:Lipoprotein n=1 Tax=uncultured bacterium (gcode 4) TaxID=1234023 RepID=K1XXP1_9BACT|nr:MAG: hypothetical protein ACD_80C00118G0022 [uncultured bacterium (gcode 4)]
MKRYSLIILFTVLILTGCKSKTFFSIPFDKFTFNLYDNNKQYISMPTPPDTIGMKVLKEMKETTGTGSTGFINSVIIVKTVIQSWTNMKELVDSNTKNLQLKLLKYKPTDNENKKVKCPGIQYSWYITAFSYQLEKDTLYGGQYFFTDDTSLYLISLSSDTPKDINSFISSINTIKCTQ